MSTNHRESTAKKPAIQLVDFEAQVMADLALRLEEKDPVVSSLLLDEIERAEIVSPPALPIDRVRIGSMVEFVNESTGRAHTVKLVLPYEANIAEGAISILTHAGAGLIGLSAGQSISWPDVRGVERTLRVTSVQPPVRL